MAKFDLTHIEIFEKGYQNFFYFSWFILLIFSMIVLLDFICLFIIAGFNLKLTRGIDIMSSLIQYVASIVIFKKFIVSGFNRIDVTWTGSAILFLLLYIIVAVFSYDKPKGAKKEIWFARRPLKNYRIAIFVNKNRSFLSLYKLKNWFLSCFWEMNQLFQWLVCETYLFCVNFRHNFVNIITKLEHILIVC